MSSETGIRPFWVDMPAEVIADLARRIAAARWPSRELVTDRSQGVQLATIQELARYWMTDYDWRRCEARLNALPQVGGRRLGDLDPERTDLGCLGHGLHLLGRRPRTCREGRLVIVLPPPAGPEAPRLI